MNIKSKVENFIVDDMSSKQINYIQAVRPNDATGELDDLYKQIRNDFQLVPPITLFSANSDMLAGLWAIARESQLAQGLVSRSDKEAVSSAVSSMNNCSYCVDAHIGILHGSSEHDTAKAMLSNDFDSIENTQTKAYVEWALATLSPQSQQLKEPPFSKSEAPEIIGTALSYHYINRMVAVFLGNSPLPVNTDSALLRSIGTRIFGATAGKSIANKKVEAGKSLKFIPEAALPKDFSWAEPNQAIANSYAGFNTLMEKAGEDTIAPEIRELLEEKLNNWSGEEMGISRQWLEEAIKNLDTKHLSTARLVFLTALSPYHVDEEIINDFQKHHPSESELLCVCCWASFSAIKRISQWITPDFQ